MTPPTTTAPRPRVLAADLRKFEAQNPLAAATLREEGARAEAQRQDRILALAKGVPGIEPTLRAALADRSVTPEEFAETVAARLQVPRTATLDALRAGERSLSHATAEESAAGAAGSVEDEVKAILAVGAKFPVFAP